MPLTCARGSAPAWGVGCGGVRPAVAYWQGAGGVNRGRVGPAVGYDAGDVAEELLLEVVVAALAHQLSAGEEHTRSVHAAPTLAVSKVMQSEAMRLSGRPPPPPASHSAAVGRAVMR